MAYHSQMRRLFAEADLSLSLSRSLRDTLMTDEANPGDSAPESLRLCSQERDLRRM